MAIARELSGFQIGGKDERGVLEPPRRLVSSAKWSSSGPRGSNQLTRYVSVWGLLAVDIGLPWAGWSGVFQAALRG